MCEVVWVGSTREEVRSFPREVRRRVGVALRAAQQGLMFTNVKPLKGFGGAGVLEVVSDHDGNTYRTVYTVRLKTAVYVLHAFQKKSTRRIATPKRELELIRRRFADAARLDTQRAQAVQGSDERKEEEQ